LGWLELTVVSIGLATDAFAVALAAGFVLNPVTPRHVFRLAFHFGLFQFLMPIIGWAAGKQFASYIQQGDHWIAFGLLGCLGGKMFWEACHPGESRKKRDPTRGLQLVGLSVATSIDALAVGLSLALLQVSIWLPAAVIGIVAAMLSTIGIVAGTRIGQSWGRGAQAIGGCLLLLIGIKILIDHLGHSP